MKAWVFFLGGLLLWAAHFFAVYIIGSLFPGTELARWLVLAVTLLGVGIAASILLFVMRGRGPEHDALDRWLLALSVSAYALAVVGIVYQGLPAVLA